MDHQPTIDAVLAGDHARFVELVRSFDRPVRRIIDGQLRDPQAREEVVQDVWCRTFRNLKSLTDARTLEPWLFRIAKNCVRDHYRAKQRMTRFEPLPEELGRSTPNEWIWDVVDALDPTHREVLTARYREHRSYAEIAESTGVPKSTIRGRLFEARNALRRRLESEKDRP